MHLGRGKDGLGSCGQRWRQEAAGGGRKLGSLVESKAGAVPSAPLSCMGNTSTNSFLKTDSR